MTRKQFAEARHILGKTQKEIAQLLGASIKSIQSFEQGWRNIPLHMERQILFLLASKFSAGARAIPCWAIRECPENIKSKCPAWEFQVGQLCWFVSGTICRGEIQSSWKNKMKICRQCEMFQRTFKSAKSQSSV